MVEKEDVKKKLKSSSVSYAHLYNDGIREMVVKMEW